MGLSLAITATGTARFAAAMGYSRTLGYVVGAIFDFGKEVLPVGIPSLWKRRALRLSTILCLAWIGLVTYSVLATHATITTAISAIEQSATQNMEARDKEKAELSSVEQQLAALTRKNVPRPVKTVRAALAGTSVPPGIWKDSRECAAIQESAYFAKACAQVVQLRTELSTAEDYERLSARANELRKSIADTPIIAASDPLPAAFEATLGHLLPVSGTEGVASLLTMVVEILSCSGLAGLKRLCISGDQTTAAGREDVYSPSVVRDEPEREQWSIPGAAVREDVCSPTVVGDEPVREQRSIPGAAVREDVCSPTVVGDEPVREQRGISESAKSDFPSSSPNPAAAGYSRPSNRAREERAGSSSNVVQMMQAPSPQRSDAAPQGVEGGSAVREDVCSLSVVRDDPGRKQRGIKKILPEPAKSVLPGSSPKRAATGLAKPRSPAREEHAGRSPNVVQMRPASSCLQGSSAAPQGVEGGSAGNPCTEGSHVPAFVQERLRRTAGFSLGATDIREAYIGWCTQHGYTPLSPQKFAAELAAKGFTKWKSCGRMRYRDLQLVA
jgi:hypothetical protein